MGSRGSGDVSKIVSFLTELYVHFVIDRKIN